MLFSVIPINKILSKNCTTTNILLGPRLIWVKSLILSEDIILNLLKGVFFKKKNTINISPIINNNDPTYLNSSR